MRKPYVHVRGSKAYVDLCMVDAGATVEEATVSSRDYRVEIVIGSERFIPETENSKMFTGTVEGYMKRDLAIPLGRRLASSLGIELKVDN